MMSFAVAFRFLPKNRVDIESKSTRGCNQPITNYWFDPCVRAWVWPVCRCVKGHRCRSEDIWK